MKPFTLFSLITIVILTSTALSIGQEVKTIYDYQFYDNFDYSDIPIKRDSFHNDYERLIFSGVWRDSTIEEEILSPLFGDGGQSYFDMISNQGLIHSINELSRPPSFSNAILSLYRDKLITSSEKYILLEWYFNNTLFLNIEPESVKLPFIGFYMVYWLNISQYLTNIRLMRFENTISSKQFKELLRKAKRSFCLSFVQEDLRSPLSMYYQSYQSNPEISGPQNLAAVKEALNTIVSSKEIDYYNELINKTFKKIYSKRRYYKNDCKLYNDFYMQVTEDCFNEIEREILPKYFNSNSAK